jgi:hypothetical protein
VQLLVLQQSERLRVRKPLEQVHVPLVQGALDLLEALQLLDQELEDVLRGTSAASARGGRLSGRRLRGATKRGRERERESLL